MKRDFQFFLARSPKIIRRLTFEISFANEICFEKFKNSSINNYIYNIKSEFII